MKKILDKYNVIVLTLKYYKEGVKKLGVSYKYKEKTYEIKKILSIILVVLLLGINVSAVCAEEFPSLIARDNRGKVDSFDDVPWGELVWGILGMSSSFVIHSEGTVENTTEYIYHASPTLWFNDPIHETGDSAEHYLDIYAPGTFLLHGHKASIDPTGKIEITLFDPNGSIKEIKDCDSNQYMEFTIPTYAFGPYGKYRCRYKATSVLPQKWQLFARYIFDPNFEWRSAEIDGYYYSNSGKVYQYSDRTIKDLKRNIDKNKELTTIEVNDQFINPEDESFVDYLKDYEVGDTLYFKDEILKVEYVEENDLTMFYFKGPDQTQIPWAFKGNLTGDYKIGDSLKLKFLIEKTEESEHYVFETLNYMREIEENDGMAPELSEYLQ